MAASSKALGDLHALFAQYWADMMVRTDETGKKLPLSASEAAVLRAFLKDNNVQADVDGNKELGELEQQLRDATKGTVSDSELEGIMDDFMRVNNMGIQ